MKTRCHRTIYSTVALALAAGVAHAQNITESFDDVEGLPLNGWHFQNNSDPIGVIGWFQGTLSVFGPAATPGYIGTNFNNGAGVATLSNWLLTPEVAISNGSQIRFWTRSVGSQWVDRLEVRMSSAGPSTNVGTTALDVGDFTKLLLTINPDLEVGEYPNEWAPYTITVSGLTSPVQGRIAFRYFVENGGPNGANSDYIGIDEFQFSGSEISTGACELSTGCEVLTSHECAAFNGVYQGNGTNCGSQPPGQYEWTGVISIPDGTGTSGCGPEAFAEIVITENQTINDISVGVHLTHAWQGDVKFALRHVESNTTVQLVDRPGVSTSDPWGFSQPNYGAAANNLMWFTESGATSYSTPAVTAPGLANVSGDWKALAPLTPFVGQSSEGTWRLIAQDCAEDETGALRVFRLEMDLGPVGPACYANCDESTTPPILNVDDFTCFINSFAQAQNLTHQQQIVHYANCDNSTTAPVLNVEDFTCFINAFAAGCP